MRWGCNRNPKSHVQFVRTLGKAEVSPPRHTSFTDSNYAAGMADVQFTYADPTFPLPKRALIRAIETVTGQPKLKRLYLEQYGDPMVTNTYLKIALVLVSIVAIGLALVDLKTIRTFQNFRPLVIRVDDLGPSGVTSGAARRDGRSWSSRPDRG